ncbi:MAG: hypothetical protein ACREVX_04365 [Clostridium sp.]|uniref:hypothetical protein n=1 Tax=Clostridium sp. TaxID=1506 RepID=UPI003D6D7543
MKKRIKTRVVITAVTAVALLSTSAWVIASNTITSKAEELGINNTYLSVQKNISTVTSVPPVTKETILGSKIKKKTISEPAVTGNTLVKKGKTYTIAIAKAKKEEIERKAEEARLAKIAAEKAAKAEVARLAKVEADKVKEEAEKVKKEAELAKQAQDAKIAKAAAQKAKQEEIDRIAAERADTAKQAQIAEKYRIAKAASDRAEQIKVDKLAKAEASRLAKVEADRLAKIEVDRLAKVEADRLVKVEEDRLAKVEADRIARIETDKVEEERLEKADPATLTPEEIVKRDAYRVKRVELNRLAQIEKDRLAKVEATKLANANAARLAKIESDKIAKIEAAKIVAAYGANQTVIEARFASYLRPAANVRSVLSRAVQLHGGDYSNNCVYFSSEAMRRIGIPVPTWTCNTKQYLRYLGSHGWSKSYDIKKLRPGSIAFTTNDWAGYPTHTFAFMGWVNSGSYTLAYVADNQGNDVHVRNMGATEATDAFAYFMHN